MGWVFIRWWPNGWGNPRLVVGWQCLRRLLLVHQFSVAQIRRFLRRAWSPIGIQVLEHPLLIPSSLVSHMMVIVLELLLYIRLMLP